MSAFYNPDGKKPQRTDQIMQWSCRDSSDRKAKHDHCDYIFVVVGNIAAAFNGERLVLARAFESRVTR